VTVHVIEEIPPDPESFSALLPIAAEAAETSQVVSDAFEVTVVEVSPGAPHSLARRSGGPSLSTVTDYAAHGRGQSEIRLQSRVGELTTLRVRGVGAELLEPDAVVLDPHILKELGPGVRLRRVAVTFVPDHAQAPWSGECWIPIARLHRPVHDGCNTVMTVASSEKVEYSANFTLVGFGGGGGVTFTNDFATEYRAEATCKEIRVRGQVSIVMGTTLVGGEAVAFGTRVTVGNIQENTEDYADVAPAVDRCQTSPSLLSSDQQSKLFGMSRARGGVGDARTDEFKLAISRTGTIDATLTFGGNVVSIGLACRRTCDRVVAIATRLTPGVDYVSFLPRGTDSLERCWTISRSAARS
jgi:hypothetical protein